MNSKDPIDAKLEQELDEAPAVGVGEAGGLEGDGGPPPPPPSPTCLELDSWSRRRGEDVLESAPQVRENYLRQGYTEVQAMDAAADFTAMTFLPMYRKAKNPEDKFRRDYIDALEEDVNFANLRTDTQLDSVASEVASWHLSQQFIEYFITRKEREQEEGDGQADKDAAADAASQAAKDAADDVDSLNALRQAAGMGQGEAGEKIPKKELLEMFRRVKGSERLKRICQFLGRYRRLAQAQQRYRVDGGMDEMVGVEMGGPLEKIMPAELANLGHPALKMLAIKKLLEKEYLSWEYDGFETKAKGPIVVVVDESGSMEGDRVCMAKALALGLYWVANYQNRWVCLVGFSGGEEGNWLTVEPGEQKPGELLDWLEHFWGGGTTCDVPLVELPKKWRELGCPSGKTDMVVITDAMVSVPEKVKRDFLTWKEESQARAVTIVIGDEPGDLEEVSDVTFSVHDLDLANQQSSEAVKAALSI